MLSLVREMTQKATEALVEGDRAKAEEVIGKDKEVDALELKIENEAITLIARHQPVASDLRLIFTVIKALTDLERSGDYAMHVAEDAFVLAQEPPLKRYATLPEMGPEAFGDDGHPRQGGGGAGRGAGPPGPLHGRPGGRPLRGGEPGAPHLHDGRPRTITKALTLMRVAEATSGLGTTWRTSPKGSSTGSPERCTRPPRTSTDKAGQGRPGKGSGGGGSGPDGGLARARPLPVPGATRPDPG
jgi:phosphate transport system protein